MLAVEVRPDVSHPIGRFQREPHAGTCRGGGPSPSFPHLAARSQRIVDREEDLAAVSSLLLSEEVPLLTLTGPAGVGKTRLAIEVGRAVAASFPDGVAFVDLAPVLDPGRVLDTLAASLAAGLDPEAGSVLERLEAALQNRTMLIILDNTEQVLPAASALAHLLAAAPGITMLVTSREPLHVRWEQVYHVLPLPVPDLQHLPALEELASIPSVALFLQRARALNPSFALSENNALAVAELVVRLDGLPLAIELAASRTTLMSPQMLLQRLGQRFTLLRWPAQDLPQRQQTLRSAIAWSYELLSSEEQTLFRHLGVFAGSFSLSAAEAIADPLGIDAIEGLALLVDKCLIQAQERGAGTDRYVLLESMRDFAREQLREAGELENVERRHARYYLDLAEQADAELRGRGQLNEALAPAQPHADPPAIGLALELPKEPVRAPAGGEVEVTKLSGASVLSAREQEALRLVAEGLSNKQIARELFIAHSTVRYHLTSVFNKLGVDTRAHAVAPALQRGLL